MTRKNQRQPNPRPARQRYRRGKCGKIMFRTKLDAEIELAWMRTRGARRVYCCNVCAGGVWHVTSEPLKTEKRTGISDPQSIDEESSHAIA